MLQLWMTMQQPTGHQADMCLLKPPSLNYIIFIPNLGHLNPLNSPCKLCQLWTGQTLSSTIIVGESPSEPTPTVNPYFVGTSSWTRVSPINNYELRWAAKFCLSVLCMLVRACTESTCVWQRPLYQNSQNTGIRPKMVNACYSLCS